jgi:hypothetical protein
MRWVDRSRPLRRFNCCRGRSDVGYALETVKFVLERGLVIRNSTSASDSKSEERRFCNKGDLMKPYVPGIAAITVLLFLSLHLGSSGAVPPSIQSGLTSLAYGQTENPPASPSPNEIIARELRSWELEKTKDKTGYAAMMAPDYIAVTGRGLMNTAQNLREIDEMTLEKYSPTDINVRFLSEDVALMTYKVAWKAQYQGKQYDENDYAAAIWAKHGTSWLDEYYQETPISTPYASPAASAEPRTDSPMEKSAVPDQIAGEPKNPTAKLLIAKEKESWAYARKKDKSSYGALLGEDFVIVSEYGVMNKNENVEDLDNLTISELGFAGFKVKIIGKRVGVLVYKVTAKGVYRGKGYNSVNYAGSVWAKTNGKWRNVFFQETPVN